MKNNCLLLLLFFTFLGVKQVQSQDLGPSVFAKETSVNLVNSPSSTATASIPFTLDKNLHFPGYTAKTVKYARAYIEIAPVSMPLSTTSNQLAGNLTVTGMSGATSTAFYDNPAGNTKTYAVTINNATPSVTIYNDFTAQYNSATPALQSIQVTLGYTNSLATASDLLTLKVRIEIAYNLDVNQNAILQSKLLVSSAPAKNMHAPRVHTFSWNTSGRYFPAYQLQVLRLYNKETSVNEPACSTTVDWSKAMTVNIENDLATTLTPASTVSYNYAITEGTGLYIWRVRAVGNANAGGFANSANYGTNWSATEAEGATVYQANIAAPTGTSFFYFKDPDENRNWIYSRVFTEKNTTKESISYADYLLHKKQTQVYLPSKRTTMLMQYVMDYLGRPAISTLSVPPQQQNLSGLLGYKTNFVLNSSSTLFRSIDFDSDAKIATPGAITISDANGFEYYKNNSNKSIPNSGGFPYMRTVFENSTNSRVSEQSGVGPYHSIGSGHTTKTLYATASDDELIRVLGDEAPKGDKVLKTTNIDPNKTASITYTDLNGKVIATCLSFNDGDLSTDPIPAGSTFDVNETIENNMNLSDGMLSSKRISFNTNSDLQLNYELPCSEALKLCGMSSANSICKYKLVVSIHDMAQPSNRLQAIKLIDNNTSCVNGKYQIPLFASDFKYVDQPGTPTLSALKFGPGDFIIEKKLLFDQSGYSTLTQQSLTSVQSTIEAFIAKVSSELENTKTMEAYNAFLNKYKCAIMEKCTTGTSGCVDGFRRIEDNTPGCTNDADEALGQFKISIQPINPSLPLSKMFSLRSSCCDIDVPVEFIPPLVCPTSFPTDPNHNYGFYDYAEKFLQAKGESLHNDANYFLNKGSELWGVFDNKVTAEADLDKMIYHMIHDDYAPAAGGTPAKQYTCEDLSKCWTAALNAVTEYNPAEVDDKNLTGIDPNEMNFDNMFDDMPGGGILKLFMGKKKKAKIKNEIKTKSQTGANDALNAYNGPSLVESLLDCAGYKYASVLITGSGTTFTGSCNTLPSTTLTGNELSLFTSSPASFWRVYNFKYVEYNPTVQLYNCEASSCFCPTQRKASCVPYQVDYEDGGPCYDDDERQYDLCDQTKNHTNWSFSKRYEFAQCIKNSTSPNSQSVETILPNDSEEADNYTCDELKANTDDRFMTVADLRAELFQMQGSCQNDCSENRELYVSKITAMFVDHCYHIVPSACDLADGDVPESDIEALADMMVAQCQSMCDISYLAARTHTCVQCEINGTPTRQYVEMIMGSAREKLLINMAKGGNFELDVKSKCSANYNQVSCDLSNMSPTTGSGFSNPCGKDYVVPPTGQDPESFFCLPQNFNPNLSPCNLDQLDANNVAQPIKIRLEIE